MHYQCIGIDSFWLAGIRRFPVIFGTATGHGYLEIHIGEKEAALSLHQKNGVFFFLPGRFYHCCNKLLICCVLVVCRYFKTDFYLHDFYRFFTKN
jgi:hypothetical protein